MVKSKNQHNQKEGVKQGEKEGGSKTRRIKASTHHGYVNEHLSSYGGLLPLVKLWDGLRRVAAIYLDALLDIITNKRARKQA